MKKVALFTLISIFILGMLLIPQSTIGAQADNPEEGTATLNTNCLSNSGPSN